LTGGKRVYQAEPRVVWLGEDWVLGFEDKLGEKNLVLAFVDLLRIRCLETLYLGYLIPHQEPAHCAI